jgi:four helix bundle protein
MSKIERFEDFIAWKKARDLTKGIYSISSSGEFARDYALRDQIRRAAISIMANIAEGFERARPSEFHQFLSTAKSSCAELRSHLYIALDAGHIDPRTFQSLMAQSEEVGRIVGGLRASVQQRRDSKSDTQLGGLQS